MGRQLRVEADGGSRGNPGIAGYGAVVIDDGAVIVRRAEPLGQASNNVAEYRGMMAGLDAAMTIDPAAQVTVALDSKLVVEQMSGRWKIKHPDMRELAAQAQAQVRQLIANGGSVTFEWIPREENTQADALSNDAMDGKTIDTLADYLASIDGGAAPAAKSAGTDASVRVSPATIMSAPSQPELALDVEPEPESEPESATAAKPSGSRAKQNPFQPTTRLILVRHGVTPFTEQGRLDGRGGADPDLSETGRAQAQRAGELMAEFLGDSSATLTTSTLQRARSTGAAVGAAIGLSASEIAVEADFDEQNFGDWDGAAARDLIHSDPEAFMRLRDDADYARPGGESHAQMAERVVRAFDALAQTPGTHIIVCHRKPIMTMLGHVLQMPHEHLFRLLAAPGSLQCIEILEGGYPQIAFTNRH